MPNVLPQPEDIAMSDWQPIKTAPKDQRILMSDDDMVSAGCWMWNSWDGWWGCEAARQLADEYSAKPGYWQNPPTKWMPLPTP
jgi:hypothetical protein